MIMVITITKHKQQNKQQTANNKPKQIYPILLEPLNNHLHIQQKAKRFDVTTVITF